MGVGFAKGLALATGKPLIPTHHLRSHIAANYLAHPELQPPFLCLVVSGGHSHIVQVEDYTHFRVIGHTRDDAAGEAFDKIARVMGMPYPGGAALDKLAYEGDPRAFALPSPALAGETLDFSFSGLKTAALNLLHSAEQRGETLLPADVAASYTRAIVDGITKKTAVALERTGARTFVIAGGVAANSHLRTSLTALCKANGVRFIAPPPALCGDNGAMVAAAGYFGLLAGQCADTSLNASAAD